jgi:hypothetical protein
MNDPSTDDLIRTAFTELRAAELPQIAPPGVDAARRTVRRRRFGAVAGTAGVAALAVVGAGYLTGAAAGQPDLDGGVGPAPVAPAGPAASTSPPTSPPTSEPPDPGATGDHGGENEAEELALDAVDFDTHQGQWLPGHSINDSQNPPGSRYNTFFVEADEPAWSRVLYDTTDPRLETDSYLVQVWCGDQAGGNAVVTLRAGDAEATTAAQCAMTEEEIRAGVGEIVLAADSADEIELLVELDEAAWADGARPVLTVVAIPQDVDLPRKP